MAGLAAALSRPDRAAEQYAIRVYAIIDGEHQPVELLSSFSPNTDNSPAFSELLFTSGVNDIRLAGIIAASEAYAEATFEQNELVYA